MALGDSWLTRFLLNGMLLVVPLASESAALEGRVEIWRPDGVSSPQFESHPAFDPRTGDLYFVRSSPDFTGWRILVSHCGPPGWSKPEPPPFAGPGLEADPYFADGGDTLYFISSRSSGGLRSRDLDIWRVSRHERGAWGTPEKLPEPVNSSAAEWFPRPAADGWLYFGSSRPGGLGGTDIWRARETNGSWTVDDLGPAVNTAGEEYEAMPAPDGSALVLATDSGFYEARRSGDGWSPRVALDPEINRNGTEIGPLFSPTGRSLLFARDTGGPDSGELFVWRRDGEDWPPECPVHR